MRLIAAILIAAIVPIMVGVLLTGYVTTAGSVKGTFMLVVMAVALAGYRHSKAN